jgi:gluconokinase
MGVAGSGKSSVMAALAERLDWPTLEGDAVHPPSNIEKMAAGIPLSDEDRRPWLEAIAAWIGDRERARESSIVACSALRRRYRDVLRRGHPWIWLVHLDVPRDELLGRLTARTGHFMAPSMLDSQLEALEPIESDEPGTTLPATDPPAVVAERIIEALRLEPR